MMRTKLSLVLIALALCVHVQGSPADEASAVEATQDRETDSQNQDAANNALDGNADNTGDTSGAQAESAAETAEDSNNEDDAENIEGMSSSLADYVLEKLTGSAGNTSERKEGAGSSGGSPTRPQDSGTSAGADADTDSSLTPQAAGETSREGEGSPKVLPTDMDSKEGADDSDDNDDNSDSDVSDQTSSTKNVASSSTNARPPNPAHKVDCDAEVDLKDYCTFTKRDNQYFKNDTTLQGLRASAINMDIVYDLMSSCPRGEWCLANMLDVFKDMQENFYHGPLCKEFMWECIFDVMLLREDCLKDKEFVFVVDVLDLLCSLTDVNTLDTTSGVSKKDGSNCFAYTLAAVHVTYADFLANGMTDMPPENEASCQGYGFRMTLTHLCADSNCKGQYDSRRAMDKWRRWSWFMVNEDERVEECKGTMPQPEDLCAPMGGNLPLMPTSSTPPFWGRPTAAVPLEKVGGVTRKPGSFGEEEESTMVALSVITAVALLFMVLGLVFLWRRSRRRGAYYYRSVSDGYEKDLSDEARLLRSAD